jgi:predicted transcriptional regulator
MRLIAFAIRESRTTNQENKMRVTKEWTQDCLSRVSDLDKQVYGQLLDMLPSQQNGVEPVDIAMELQIPLTPVIQAAGRLEDIGLVHITTKERRGRGIMLLRSHEFDASRARGGGQHAQPEI